MPDNPSISDPTASTKQFSSRYELNHKLGAGGMGVVYKGYDKVLSKQVAVKLLLPSLKKEAAIRFQKEARAAAKLDHLNILKVLDFGQTETGELYLIMDFIEGESLSDLIKRQGPLDVNLAVDIFLQLSSGLEHAHRNSVLHRDVKPSNVMLVKSPGGGYICKIVDFGLAKLDSEEQKLTATGARIGSPMYMSPEQARGEEVDLRSDIYSLGCLMYMTLKGKPPFLGDSYMETIAMQIEQPAPKLNDGLSSQRFPTALEEIVDKTLQKEPTKRFQSMEELRQALQEFSEHHSSNEPPEGVGFVLPKVRPIWAIAILLLFTVFSVMAILSLNNAKHEKEVLHCFEHGIGERTWLIASGPMHDNLVKNIAEEYRSKKLLKIVDPEFSDSDLPYLSVFPYLQALDVSFTKVTDAGLETIAGFHELRGLTLDSDKITDRGMKTIMRMHGLRHLSIRHTDITDAGVEMLSKTNLNALDISDNGAITGKSIEYLSNDHNLYSLLINGDHIDKKHVHMLGNFKPLDSLAIANLNLNDEDLAALHDVEFLNLDISGNKDVTINGIKKLKYGCALTWILNVRGCNLSEDDIEQIRERRVMFVAPAIISSYNRDMSQFDPVSFGNGITIDPSSYWYCSNFEWYFPNAARKVSYRRGRDMFMKMMHMKASDLEKMP